MHRRQATDYRATEVTSRRAPSRLNSQPQQVPRMFTVSAIRSGIGLVCLVAGSLSLSGCNPGTAATSGARPAPEVSVSPVVARAVRGWDQFNGRVSAIDTVSLRPRVSGYIESIAYKEGDEVKKGDLLFRIDQRPYRDALNDAQARLERARTAENTARTQAERAEKLIAAKAISQEEVESRRADLAQARADVRAADAAVATATLNFSFTEVRSPVAGRAGRAMLSAGNLARADDSVLTTVVSQDPMYVYFDCDERSYLRYQALARSKPGQKEESTVRVAVSDDAGFPRLAKLDFLDNHINPETGTIRARAVLSNHDRRLTPGMYARVRLNGDGEFQAMLINDRAVLTDQNRKYVYVLGEDNKALRKDIVIGRLIEDPAAPSNQALRVVQSGLDGGDKVIVGGTQKIFYPGMQVKPAPVATDAAQAAPAKSAS